MSTYFAPFAALVARHRPVRVWSLLVTVMGDAVLPRGGEIALGALQDIAGTFGIEGGAVRTALTRLSADGIVSRRRKGAASYVSLSDAAAAEFANASQLIYAGQPTSWAGTWTIHADGPGGVVAPGVIIRPVLRAPGQAPPDQRSTDEGRALARRAWAIDETAARWRAFLEEVNACVPSAPALRGLEALAGRVAMLHRYRRIVLKAPDLPVDLLPMDWPGHAVRDVVADIYSVLSAESERWLGEHGRRADGSLPPPNNNVRRRFLASADVTKRIDIRSIS